jgi:hypothetical protein
MMQPDNGLTALKPIDLREYAQAKGWKLVGEALKDDLFLLNSPNGGRQLVIPKNADAPDFPDAARIFVEKLADIEDITLDSLIHSIKTVGDDTIRIGVPGTGRSSIELPLSYTQELLSAARQMIMASACNVIRPQILHPRLSRVEAQQMIDKSSFGHTEQGSFVLRISCPIDAVDYTPKLFDEPSGSSFVRLTILNIIKASSELVLSVDSGLQDDLVAQQKNSPMPIISANLCEGLARLYDDRLDGAISLSVDWSPKQRVPAGIPLRSQVTIPKEYFSRIYEVGAELRRSTAIVPDTYVGTVERLDGEMGDHGRRSGDVIVALLLNEGETVRSRLTLDADQYEDADRAHMTKGGAYVRASGILYPGRQPRRMTDITEFSVITGA